MNIDDQKYMEELDALAVAKGFKDSLDAYLSYSNVLSTSTIRGVFNRILEPEDYEKIKDIEDGYEMLKTAISECSSFNFPKFSIASSFKVFIANSIAKGQQNTFAKQLVDWCKTAELTKEYEGVFPELSETLIFQNDGNKLTISFNASDFYNDKKAFLDAKISRYEKGNNVKHHTITFTDIVQFKKFHEQLIGR